MFKTSSKTKLRSSKTKQKESPRFFQKPNKIGPQDSFKVYGSKRRNGSPRSFKQLQKPGIMDSLKFVETTSKTKKGVPEILSDYFKNKTNTISELLPNYFKN